MADEVTNKAATDDNADATKAAPEAPAKSDAELNAETSLSKDGDLSINQTPATTEAKAADEDMAVSKPAEPVATTPSAAAVDFTPPPSSQPIPADTNTKAESLISPAEASEKTGESVESPVTVTPAEAAAAEAAPAANSAEQELGAQVETLTGEIQALESKIERLATNDVPATAVAEPAKAADMMPAAPTEPAPIATEPPKNPDVTMPPLTDPSPEAEPKPETALPAEKEAVTEKVEPNADEKTAVATFSDIFSKSDKEKPDKKAETTAAPASLMPDAPATDSDVSATATIGEVLAFFGIVVLAALLLGPLYKSLLSEDLYSTVKSVAWLVAPSSLLISFIVLLFAKGKGLFKAAVLILLIVAIVFYLGVNTSGSISDQLNNYLGTLFSAYK